MEKLKHYLISVVVAFLIVYLIGSFYNANFDIREWTPGVRALGAGLIFIASVLMLITSFGVDHDSI